MLMKDFFHNYFALDSRFVSSIRPFLLKPGQLTKEFIQGKRVRYMHPVRLYLLLSLFYFFILSVSGSRSDGGIETDDSAGPFNLIINEDSDPDSLSILSALDSIPMDSSEIVTLQNLDEYIQEEVEKDTTDSDEDGIWMIKGENWKIFEEFKDDDDVTDDEILEKMDTEGWGFWKLRVARQMIRIQRSDDETVEAYVTKNLPIMMFFLLPVFALILKLLYIRRNRLYIQHLIHSIHIHAFAYLIYGATLALVLIVNDDEVIGPILLFIGLVTVTVYAYKSYRRVYEQRRFKTIVKFLLTGVIYTFTLIVALALEVVISLFFY